MHDLFTHLGSFSVSMLLNAELNPTRLFPASDSEIGIFIQDIS